MKGKDRAVSFGNLRSPVIRLRYTTLDVGQEIGSLFRYPNTEVQKLAVFIRTNSCFVNKENSQGRERGAGVWTIEQQHRL